MKWISVALSILLLVVGLTLTRCHKDGNVIDTVATPIAQSVTRISVAEEYYNRKVQLKTQVYYRANEYHRAWLQKRRPKKIFKAFVHEVKESSQYGLVPEDYHVAELEQAVESLYDNRKRTQADISDVDIQITASFFLFTTHLIEGRVRHPGAREFLWERGMPLENDIVLLLNMESASDVRKELEKLQPTDPQYVTLQRTLKKYRELEQADSFPALPAKLQIQPGDKHEAIPLVRKRLSLTDYDYKNSDDTVTLYDEKLTKAVKKFQTRHGLSPDGVIEKETVKFLNLGMKERAELIALNLERLRWKPQIEGMGDRIIINVPEYMLRVYKNNKEKMAMRVVLGSEYTPTPVFQDTLRYIVFSPTWMVPKSIFEKEFFPKLQDDPGHFDPQRFRFYKDGKEIDPFLEPWSDKKIDLSVYKVVENPGDENSLGNIKFIMPNDFSIYLHDTPADQLFKREDRALSHGCIRLERPEALAEYLLSDQQEWNKKKIQEAFHSDKPLQVDLKDPIPVYIVYRTVWVDDDGVVNFREDIYGHDQRHLQYLAHK